MTFFISMVIFSIIALLIFLKAKKFGAKYVAATKNWADGIAYHFEADDFKRLLIFVEKYEALKGLHLDDAGALSLLDEYMGISGQKMAEAFVLLSMEDKKLLATITDNMKPQQKIKYYMGMLRISIKSYSEKNN